jgi:hypothetical protein
LTFGAPWSVAAGVIGLAQAASVVANPLPQIPSFESGGISAGGLAQVGERGREMVNLPAGAQIINHTKTLQTENRNAFSVANITLPNVTNGQQFFEELQAIQRSYGVI